MLWAGTSISSGTIVNGRRLKNYLELWQDDLHDHLELDDYAEDV